jgi:hypothetical protein
MGNYALPRQKILDKLEKYDLNQFPREKLHEMQRNDDFGRLLIDYLENDELPGETKMAKIISIMGWVFIRTASGIR